MPLSDHEQRMLDQIESALYAEDPKFASSVRGGSVRVGSARRRLQGAILRVEGQSLAFDVDGAEFVVDAANIEKAKLVPDWVALGLAPAVDKSGRDLRPGKQKKKSGKNGPAADRRAGEPSNTQPAAEQSPDAE